MASSSSSSWALLFFALFALSKVSNGKAPSGLVMDFYKESCPQAEEIIREQVKLLYKRHKNTAFSWLRNLFHDCAVESCDASLLLDSTKKTISEKETDRSFGMRNFRYLEDIKDAVERECPGVVSCSDILVLSARDGIVSNGKEVERRKGAHSVGRTHCVKLVHRLYPEVDPALNPDHVPHMLKKCYDPLPDPKAVQYVRNDRGTPMKLDNNYYVNILENKGLLMVDHELAHDPRTRPYVKKMAKSQDYFFQHFSRAIALLSENNPLTGEQGEIRRHCNLANKRVSED
ncbi:Peroxidase 42 [Platanthera guangdongensis]|uniref:Peroxidase n=1 Tax=Platanthera guangdongensis TaxID=2320717 RepID=A0ABR2N587_9ASPA